MERDDEVKGAGNSVDFGARMYDSRLGRWFSRDPMESKYPQVSSYLGFSDNPILIIDPDGADWTDYKETIDPNTDKKTISMTLNAATMDDTGQMSNADMSNLNQAIIDQNMDSFNVKWEEQSGSFRVVMPGEGGQPVDYPIYRDDEFKLKVVVRTITNKNQLNSNEHLVTVTNLPKTNTKRVLGRINKIGGTDIKLSVSDVQSMICKAPNQDVKTISHEFGHTAGLLHPNEECGFFKNGEQYIEDGKHDDNLMFQSGYTKNLKPKRRQNELLPLQIQIFIRKYKNGELNQK